MAEYNYNIIFDFDDYSSYTGETSVVLSDIDSYDTTIIGYIAEDRFKDLAEGVTLNVHIYPESLYPWLEYEGKCRTERIGTTNVYVVHLDNAELFIEKTGENSVADAAQVKIIKNSKYNAISRGFAQYVRQLISEGASAFNTTRNDLYSIIFHKEKLDVNLLTKYKLLGGTIIEINSADYWNNRVSGTKDEYLDRISSITGLTIILLGKKVHIHSDIPMKPCGIMMPEGPFTSYISTYYDLNWLDTVDISGMSLSTLRTISDMANLKCNRLVLDRVTMKELNYSRYDERVSYIEAKELIIKNSDIKINNVLKVANPRDDRESVLGVLSSMIKVDADSIKISNSKISVERTNHEVYKLEG